jgi:tRNA threonylcarbamoyladenosine biosynthesis protein TsaE
MIELELKGITIDALPEAAKQIIATGYDYKIWTFYGEMGAGKTTFIKSICNELGVIESVSSPTFSLVNEYKTSNNGVIYHFDFYRIKSIEEVYDIGYEDYFYSGNLCLVEWPEKIEELLANEICLAIRIEKESTFERCLNVKSTN